MNKEVKNCGGIELPKKLKLIEEEEKNGEVGEQLRRGEDAEASETSEKVGKKNFGEEE